MTSNDSSFKANVSRGVQHHAGTDIESIRDLLRGYGSGASILKELIQNAEDAESPRLDFIYLPSNRAAGHSLARGPGLMVINNGPFTVDHREAIFQINLGTKGTDHRAIGRFGKGLKSVFAWCEAFFIVAHTDQALGWPVASNTDMFNPWHGWRHRNWEEEFDQYGAEITARAQHCARSIYSEDVPWLAFWFPLRDGLHKKDSYGEVDWIFEGSGNPLPGDDSKFMARLAAGLRDLAPSLVNLRHLEQINMGDEASLPTPNIRWRFRSPGQRIPAPDDAEQSSAIAGETLLRDGASPEDSYRYSGVAGLLPTGLVSHLEESPDWPRVVNRKLGPSTAGSKAKGKPHFATLITSAPTDRTDQQGSLEIRWCVFFPVGKQPVGTSEVRLAEFRRNVVVNLHGFFFLDSERLRIDGLETCFSYNGTISSKSCLEWNRIVATRGSLVHLPQAFAAFARNECLTSVQCCELADAMRKTWVWSGFQKDACSADTWRPRWQNGRESWQCLSAAVHVLPIPHTPEPREVLKNVPQLAAISEERTLSVRRIGGSPGLYADEFGHWPEALVLRLLEDVHLGDAPNEATATWTNDFLDCLFEQGTLTPAIRARFSGLPLLPVRDARTTLGKRISFNEWTSLSAARQLFTDDTAGAPWFRLLCSALPGWSCYVSSAAGMPRWFRSPDVPSCDATAAAAATLAQTSFGAFPNRASLVQALIQHSSWDLDARHAIRYLMHVDGPNARADSTLFVPSTQQSQQIWSRIIGLLLRTETGAQAWRLLDNEWGPALSPQVQKRLGVYTVDAEGAWLELTNGDVGVDTLRFPSDEWSAADISGLLKGLFEAGKDNRDATIGLLRKLRLHTQRGAANERVSIAAGNGALDERFVLDQAGFEDQLPNDLRPLWQGFLAETKIIERLPEDDLASTVQKYLFERVNADNTRDFAELDWNYIVRRSLATADPSGRAPLIMEALSHGDQAARGIGQAIKTTAWLPLSLTGSIKPQNVIVIEGLEADLGRLLDPTTDGLAGLRALPEWISSHDGFPTLRKYFPGTDESIRLLGLWLEDKPDYRLGLSAEFQPTELAPILSELSDFEYLPAAQLLTNLRRVRVRGDDAAIDSLLRNCIFPAVLRRFDYSEDGLDKLKNTLLRLQGRQSRTAFDAYLSQACRDARLASLLPQLSLVNQHGQWVSASQLTWPSTNIDAASQLCPEQAAIISSLHSGEPGQDPQIVGAHQIVRQTGRFAIAPPPDFGAEVAKLSEFLRPFRNGNVGDSLPAALVAVLGDHWAMLDLLRELLRSALKQDREDFLALLLGDKRNNLDDKVRFVIQIVKGARTETRSLTNESITVDLTRDITTLIVGDPTDLWWHYESPGTAVTCHLLRLRAIERPDELEDPVAVFASTVETIILKAHCNGVARLCPTDIKAVLGDVADGGQADLRHSRAYLLDMAEARLKELGIRGVPEVDLILHKFGEARKARVYADLQSTRDPSRSRQRFEDAAKLVEAAKKDLVALLEATPETPGQRALLEAVRRKMTDFQYNVGSVALELFQNADDAVAELRKMQVSLEPISTEFVVQFDSPRRTLEFIHWGRPINQHECPGFQDGLAHGYDQDLHKMLTLNFSDKGVAAGTNPAIVTGRFGLGFKSVFFVSALPEVISGRLAFEIRGGFFPVPLSQSVAEEMRGEARRIAASGPIPTSIRLRWAQDLQLDQLSRAIDTFSRIIPLLTIFSRQIRTVRLSNNGTQSTWMNVEEKVTDSGRITCARIGGTSFICFRCPLSFDQQPAVVLFRLIPSGISQLEQELTGLWITVPTAERSELRWAVNAPFKPDAGRQLLARKNAENRNIAEEVARSWGDALLELFDFTTTGWAGFSELLNLHSDASHGSWWKQTWRETTSSKPVLQWESIKDGGQVLNWIAWGSSVGGMRRLVQQRAAIPTDLPGPYSTLVNAESVRFCVTGLLAEIANGCFANIARWESIQATFPPGHTVNANIGTFLRDAELGGAVVSVTLEQLLASEIGPQQHVTPLVAERLGILFKECEAVFEPSTSYSLEVQRLFTTLKQVSLLGTDGAFHQTSGLTCNRELAGVIDEDEVLRAAFAPDSAVLSNSYSDIAFGFFIRARGQLMANATTLATWAREAAIQKLPSVFRYLLVGTLGQQLADQLGRPWFELKKGTPAWPQLSMEDQSELERKFAKGLVWTPSPSIPLPGVIEVKQEMDPEEAFRLISQWWKDEKPRWIARYEEKTYPSGFPGSLPWPGEDAWDEAVAPSAQSRWLILFVHAALVPLGFNMIGRDQAFSHFLVANKWLDVLSNVPQDPGAVLRVIDQYLNRFIENTQYHFQMRQFIAFYAVAKNLETFLLSLKETDRSNSAAVFRMALAPKANFAFTGTGIEAPPLTGMLGTGSCQLYRELYRLGRLTSPQGYPFAFTPIRKVRRLCTQLFGIPEGPTPAQSSEIIFGTLAELGSHLGLDPTFDHCFDLPLQFLAQDALLRTRVLNVMFEAESGDDDSLDAAPQMETTP